MYKLTELFKEQVYHKDKWKKHFILLQEMFEFWYHTHGQFQKQTRKV